MTAWWLIVPLPVFVLAMTCVNVLSWPRGRVGPVNRRVSVLIPARNEAAAIGDAVAAARANPVHEVVVYDDQSTDATADLARAAGARVLSGLPLPPGWVGKVHACHQLAAAATGDTFLFLDADVRLEPDGLARVLDLADRTRADVVTAVPRQETGSWAEALIIPLLHLTYTSWLPLRLIPMVSDPRILAANGQLLAIERGAYVRAGGFAAVRGALVDDMAICHRAKATGHRVVFADGHRMARCRMYQDARGVWEGFSKNIAPGLGGSLGLLAAIGLYLTAFVVPWIALAAAAGGFRAALVPACLAAGANLLQRGVLGLRHGHAALGVYGHLPAVLGLIAIALNSWRWTMTGRIRWSGRTYAS